MKKTKKRSFVVIGLGMFGGTVAPALAQMGDDVLGVDIDEGLVRKYANRLTHTAILDARDEVALREAGVGNFDVAIVAIGENLEANILASMNVKALGIKEIWVKAQSLTHHKILLRIGVTKIIHPERDMGLQVAETLHTPYVTDYINLGSDQYLVSFILQEDMLTQGLDKFVSKNDSGACLVGAMRGDKFIDFTNIIDITTETGDRLLAIGTKEQLRKLSGLL
ncbi:MAG: TrkA family potassium uptake protein [Alphaproteobacteria bacterium]|nr:TrkA family potassium uptake protein [Alphaproteobacteria bacterium]